jgi:hypothetical protein
LFGAVVLRAGLLLASVGRGPGCVGRTGWAGAAFAALSSLTTTCRIAGAQPMSAGWRGWWDGGVVDGTGASLGWPDGVGPVSVVSVGPGVAGAVVTVPTLGLSVGVAIGITVGTAVVTGLDGVVGCGAGVWGGAWDALWIGVLVGAGVVACGDDGVPGVDPPPLLTGPAAGNVAKSPCS